jgi:hypothetical protein|tara:strand:- start:806 stop:1222 length:417 start_codon:yes stop_codon:yes gene_type:complete
MDNKVTFRTFKEGDYEMCCDWWRWWWKGKIPVKKAFLPRDNRCFMIESNGIPVAASFLYTDELMGYLTWTVSNPKYRNPDRRQLLEFLITKIEEEAKDVWGVKFLLTVCGNKHLEKMHRKLNWFVEDSAPSYECFKYL